MPRSFLLAAVLTTFAVFSNGTSLRAQSAPAKVKFEQLSSEGIRQALEYALANPSNFTQIPVLNNLGITIVPSGVVYQPAAGPGLRPTLQVPYRGGGGVLSDAGVAALREFVDGAVGQRLLEGPGALSERVTITPVPEQSVAPFTGAVPAMTWALPQTKALPSLQAYGWSSPVAPGTTLAGWGFNSSMTAGGSFGQGYDRYWQGRYAEALADFNNAVRRDPRDPRFWYYKGLAEAALSDRSSAEASFRQGGVTERMRGSDRKLVGRSLERVQGVQRVWLEQVARR
jgi:hypothetical protein